MMQRFRSWLSRVRDVIDPLRTPEGREMHRVEVNHVLWAAIHAYRLHQHHRELNHDQQSRDALYLSACKFREALELDPKGETFGWREA